jgi:pimeloyl-ACP methyl ester carboxylesterase
LVDSKIVCFPFDLLDIVMRMGYKIILPAKLFSDIVKLILLIVAGVLISCKPSGDVPPWEVNDLTFQVRQQAGGSYASLSQGVTHYELSGPASGRTVVLVHGSTLPMWTWDRLVGPLADSGFRVLRYDHFGRGYSDRPSGEYTIDMYRTQLRELLDVLGITGPVSLVGISFGCAIIANYASCYPGSIDRMIFTAPLVNQFNELSKLLTESPAGAAFVKGQIKKQVEGSIRKTLADRGMPGRYADLFIEQASIKGFQRSLISFLRNTAETDYRPFYKKTGASVQNIMLIWGDDDKTVRIGQVRAFEKAIPRAKVEILPGIGHMAPFEATGKFNGLVLDFLTTK